jgi:hypothetical protein
VADHAEGARARLLETIGNRRDCIVDYIRAKSPASTRLSTISIVSSAVAAALTAGPAFGGSTFAETVQSGLDLRQSEVVWRLLCFGALAVSVTAAISANLSKAHDLTSRIAAAEAAGATLHGLATRLEFGRLSVEDAAQEYRDIVAGIPFVPDMGRSTSGRSERGRRTSGVRDRLGVVSSLAAAVALAVLLLVVTLVGYGVGLAGPSAADGGTSSVPAATPSAGPAEPSSPVPTPSPTPVATIGVFAGKDSGGGPATVAVVVSDGAAKAYVCDGEDLEAWLNGPVGADELDLRSESGARLTGEIAGDVVSVRFERPGLFIDFRATRSKAPAGVYQAKIQENGQDVVFGWAVLPDGSQVGIENNRGSRSRAPQLNTGESTFFWKDKERTASRFT